MKVSTTSPFFSVALLVISMLSIQCSASLAKSVFPIIGPEATTALRLMFAALVLLPVMRPWRAKLTRKQWLPIILYGLSTGVMNMCFYRPSPHRWAAARVHRCSDIAVRAPSTSSCTGCRRSVVAHSRIFRQSRSRGRGLALGAGFCWAMYIFFGKWNAGGAHPSRSA
ncbi:MAG: EamA family transporter [Bilophila wadsworthia]